MDEFDVDAALRVWREEGPDAYGPAQIADYIAGPSDPPPGPERSAALAALRAADEEMEEMNRALMRRAINAALHLDA